ncbi:hypothetical protein APHAL10511_004946 [Amanita phalloides]|nr:hypothetical protein APHAL10511_004946 [Amanita phalloides]
MDSVAALPSSSVPLVKAERDPHLLPIFTTSDPAAPILYLPPLLSSLPQSIVHDPPLIERPFPPLVTETRLPDIDPASLSLHKALHAFRPSTPRYAEAPYEEAFNWLELFLPEDEEREWYCVVFRSKREAGSNSELLYEADKLAHEEAVRNGGLILYWYGTPDSATGMNLATCVWQSRRHAIAANARPHHIKAMKLAAESYEVYNLERYRLVKLRGMTNVFIVPYNGGDVGW